MRSNLGIAETSQTPYPEINQGQKKENQSKSGWNRLSQNCDSTCEE